MSKPGYEEVPDVEKAEGGVALSAKEKYPEFNDQQTELLWNMDNAIESTKIDLSLPKIDPSDLRTQGQGFLKAMIQPTVASACMLAIALFLDAKQKASEGESKFQNFLVVIFPYANAAIIFASSFVPIQKRFLDAVEPVYRQIKKTNDTVNTSVDEITKNVDSTVDAIQMQVNEVIEPMKPKLDQASAQLDVLKKIDPDLDVPDTADLNREFDEAQGLVGAKVEEAKGHLNVQQYIPDPLRTADSFYWKIVFPAAVVLLLLQLILAWISTYQGQDGAASDATMANSTEKVSRFLQEAAGIDFSDDSIPDVTIPGMNISELSGQAVGEVQQVQEQAAAYTDELQNQYNSGIDQLNATLGQFSGEINAKVEESKNLVVSVISSYIMALLQLGLVYILTNERFKAWILNKIMQQATDGAMRTLREFGVASALEDVMGTRMARIRSKMLRILQVYSKIERVLEKVGNAMGIASKVTENIPIASEAISNISDKAVDIGKALQDKKGGMLGRFIGK